MPRLQLIAVTYYSMSMILASASQEIEVTSTPIRTVENVKLTMKGLQDRNIQMLDGTTVKNKGKIIN